MNNAWEVSKLAELHLKTDRQLADMVDKTLENGLILAAAAGAAGDRTLADRFLSRARACSGQAERLLSMIHDPERIPRKPLEQKLVELRTTLEAVMRDREDPRLTVCC